jgi:acyl-CoA thioesterase
VSPTRFERDTAVRRLAEGEYEATLDRGWWIVVGPNGGYLAATLLRAMAAEVADPERAPRSLTVHYLSPAREGAVRIAVQIERAGRSLSSVSARLEQDGNLVALALGAFAKPRPSPIIADLAPPDFPPPESLPVRSDAALDVPLRRQLDTRSAFGVPQRASRAEARVGGWLRTAEPQRVDPFLLALFSDSWWPAVSQHQALAEAPLRGMPTVDLTVHFRSSPPRTAKPDDFYACLFRSRTLRDGFWEEDGEIWSQDGVLLAQSRQLALLV